MCLRSTVHYYGLVWVTFNTKVLRSKIKFVCWAKRLPEVRKGQTFLKKISCFQHCDLDILLIYFLKGGEGFNSILITVLEILTKILSYLEFCIYYFSYFSHLIFVILQVSLGIMMKCITFKPTQKKDGSCKLNFS